MTNALDYASRLEKKIDVLQSEVKTLTDIVTRLSVINENHNKAYTENTERFNALSGKLDSKFDDIDKRIDALQNKASQIDGGVGMFRWLAGLSIGALLGACSWIGLTVIELSQNNQVITERVAVSQADIAQLEAQVGR